MAKTIKNTDLQPCEEPLIDALQDNFTPEAIAAIAADLTPTTNDGSVNQQVVHFRRLLIGMLGDRGYAEALETIGY